MYKIDDIVVYGSMGVCRVIDISGQKHAGGREDQMFYTLQPLYQQCVIHIPVGSTKVFMRPVISKEEARRLIALIPTIRAVPYHSKGMGGTSALVGHYAESIKSHDCQDLLELTMSIYAKKQEQEDKKRKFGAVDQRYMQQAEELLFGELAVALGIPAAEVPAYIASQVEEAQLADRACVTGV